MSREANLALVRELYDAFGKQDGAALARLLAHATWRVPGRSPLAGAYRGAQEILGYFGQLRERSGGTFHAQVEDVLASEDRAAVLARATGARAGRTYDARYVLLLEIADGAIREATLLNEDPAAFDAFWS